MKKIIILFLSLILITSSALPVFAADSLQDWVDYASMEEQARIDEIENKLKEEYGECEMKSYPMKHIKDNTFFQKISFFNKMDKFISDKNDIITFVFLPGRPEEPICHIYYGAGRQDESRLPLGSNICTAEVVPNEYVSFLTALDEEIQADKFGKIKECSLLFGTFVNFKLNIEEMITTLEIAFVYIQSDGSEFLIPYIFAQTRGEPVLENGKIYTLAECADILDVKLSTLEFSWTEETDEFLIDPLEIMLMVVLIAAVAVGSVFGVKALTKHIKTKSNDRYDF